MDALEVPPDARDRRLARYAAAAIAASLVEAAIPSPLPGFFLSASGALASLLALGALLPLPARWLGPVGRSVAAAFAHIAGQLLLARLWLVPHDGLFNLAPVFFAAALVFGIVNGVVAARLLRDNAA